LSGSSYDDRLRSYAADILMRVQQGDPFPGVITIEQDNSFGNARP
jgi:hypothetical protein